MAKSDELKKQSDHYAQASDAKANEILELSKRLQRSDDKIIQLSDFIRNE